MRAAILISVITMAAALAAPPAAKTPVLTLREKIAQLIIAPCYGENPNVQSPDYRKFVHWVRDLKVGGLIVLNRVVYGNVRNAEPFAMAAFLNQMQRLSKTPLLVGADLERGASMRVANTTKFPHSMAFGAARDLNATRQEGATVARESRALGVHWVFAPVADVNNNPENPVIGTRSFGERASEVASHVEAYIDGARSDPRNRVLVCVKHFPGHGDTNIDSHYGLGSVGGDRKRLDEVELVPFKAAIRKNVDGVMTAHLTVPVIEPEEIPATVSQPVLTGLLRKELGFQGLIVTDAMDMAGLTKMFPPGEAAVRALIAGADVLLMPANPDAVVNAVAKAIAEGRISEKRIDRSVAKIMSAKTRLGLFQKRLVDLEGINKVLESPEMDAVAQSTADRAVTMVRNDKDVFPLSSTGTACLYVLTDNRRNTQGLRLMDEVRARDPKVKAVALDSGLPETAFNDALPTQDCKSVIVATFNGGSTLHPSLDAFVSKIVAGSAPVGLVALGNPYLLKSYPTVAGYLATYSNTPTAELAAVKALFGEIKLNGRLPVTIPGLANYGDGIQMPARTK
jgi:beta-N-acetylhexosaminidase